MRAPGTADGASYQGESPIPIRGGSKCIISSVPACSRAPFPSADMFLRTRKMMLSVVWGPQARGSPLQFAVRSQFNRTDSRVGWCIASPARDCYPCIEGAPKRKKCTDMLLVEGDGEAEVVMVVVESKE